MYTKYLLVKHQLKSIFFQSFYRKVEDLQFKLEEEEITLGDELKVHFINDEALCLD